MPTDLTARLVDHRFFADLDKKQIARFAACGELCQVTAGTLLVKEGSPATAFYALLSGRVAIETRVPSQPPITLQTVESGDVIGWSWIDAEEWVFDVRTLTDCELIALDAEQVMKVLTGDSELGMEIMRRLNRVVSQRLRATRLQLLDIYGKGTTGE